ncbi:hypothetical protein GGI42DRAFT_318205 [Trichoderma sp. SZMC 28013]
MVIWWLFFPFCRVTGLYVGAVKYSHGSVLCFGEGRVLPGDCMDSQYVLMQAGKPQLPSNISVSSSFTRGARRLACL